jgi:hypothetical protein
LPQPFDQIQNKNRQRQTPAVNFLKPPANLASNDNNLTEENIFTVSFDQNIAGGKK